MEPISSDREIPRRRQLSGTFLVLIAAFGFSAKAVIIKLGYQHSGQVDAISFMVLRMAMALPFFLITGFWLNKGVEDRRLGLRDWSALIGLGVIGYYLASFLDFSGLVYISAGLERLILFLYPTLVILFSAVIFRRPIHPREIIALVLSYSGIALVVLDYPALETDRLILGSALVFGSAMAFAFFMIGSGVMVKKMGSARFTAYSMTIACIATGLHFGIHHSSDISELPREIYGLAFIMAIFSTVLPAFFMNAGIRRIGSGSASVISSAGPVGTLVLAYFLLNETIGFTQLAGSTLVMTGIYIVGRRK